MSGAGEGEGGLDADLVVEALRNAGRQMERTPGTWQSSGEEGLRDALLLPLSAITHGRAVAEAFNGRGKTDILVRVEDRNLFLAECKIYAGPKGLAEAADQLFGYTGWRERRVGLIVFVRSVTMSTAINAARKALDGISSIRSVEDVDPEGSELVARADHPADPEVELEIAVQLFHLPIPREREKLVGGEVVDREPSLSELVAASRVAPAEGGIAYLTHAGPPEVDLPIPPGALLRLERLTPEGRVAVDAVPLTEAAAAEYAPAGAIEVSDPTAARALRRALRDNVAVEFSGARMRFDRLPPLFRGVAEELAEADSRHVTMRLAPRGVWQCRMVVETDRGHHEVPMAFLPIQAERADEAALRGSFHDLSLTIKARRGGETAIDWNYSASDAPVRERLASLDLLHAMSGKGEISFESIDPPRTEPMSLQSEGGEFDEALSFERRLFEALVLIEDYLRIGFELPDEIGEEDLRAIFTAAETIRTGAATVRIDKVAFEVKGGLLENGDEIEVRGLLPLDITIFGDKLNLGVGDGTLLGRVAELERHGEVDHVSVVPRDAEAARVAVTGLQRPPSTEAAQAPRIVGKLGQRLREALDAMSFAGASTAFGMRLQAAAVRGPGGPPSRGAPLPVRVQFDDPARQVLGEEARARAVADGDRIVFWFTGLTGLKPGSSLRLTAIAAGGESVSADTDVSDPTGTVELALAWEAPQAPEEIAVTMILPA